MKRLFILSLVAVLTMLGCASGKTVALVEVQEDGDVSVYCTGVWIGQDEILAA